MNTIKVYGTAALGVGFGQTVEQVKAQLFLKLNARGVIPTLIAVSEIPASTLGTNYAYNLTVFTAVDEPTATTGARIKNALNDVFSVVKTFVYDTPTTPTTPTTTNPTTGGGGYYTVKSGDTLSKIANAHNTTVAELARINGISNVNLIRVGQRLLISGASQNQPQPTTPVVNNPLPLPNNNPLPQPQPIPQPQPNQKAWYAPFYENQKLTAVGIAGLILVGGIVLTSKK